MVLSKLIATPGPVPTTGVAPGAITVWPMAAKAAEFVPAPPSDVEYL
jgi:hypothetical protein